jgi:uncharacterized protein YcbK (DUF882 family)
LAFFNETLATEMNSCEHVIFIKMLEQIQGSMQSAEEKRHASVSELATKHQKVRKRKAERKYYNAMLQKY